MEKNLETGTENKKLNEYLKMCTLKNRTNLPALIILRSAPEQISSTTYEFSEQDTFKDV